MRTVLVIMTGIGFFLGVVFGLLLQLPIDDTLPADASQHLNYPLINTTSFRSRRSLSKMEDNQLHDENLPFRKVPLKTITDIVLPFSQPASEKDSVALEKQKLSNLESKQYILKDESDIKPNKGQMYIIMEALKRQSNIVDGSSLSKQTLSDIQSQGYKRIFLNNQTNDVAMNNRSFQKLKNMNSPVNIKLDNSSKASVKVSLRLTLQQNLNISGEKAETITKIIDKSHDSALYLASLVNGVIWTHHLENSCPKPFQVDNAESWRRKVEGLDVVRMGEGCGRMQNRLITFRDASKACARYRLNTDQIQGEIFSYYLARVFNISNIPPTVLARVETLSSKWRTVHLQLSQAQWAETKLVVLTQHIDGLLPAHIPAEFREEGRRLEPTLADLGSKSHTQLCELVQWSDLIVFDYLTANLDRVINNMFNRQWNDQMMSSPAHNLEKQADGSLVFLDNESGLFHGYRLLDKYSTFHRTLLQSLCVFRPSTSETIKRLHKSSGIADELHALFTASEVLHKHLATIPEKNIKILQQRVDDVYKQILHCESLFNR